MRSKGLKARGRRLLAGALSLALLAGFLPVSVPQAAAADEWMQPYLDKLVTWGVMRGDQNGSLDPNRAITRSEFVSMVNRAYGYTDANKVPFEDVPLTAWYYDDIGIAYGAGYFSGTSDTTASPQEQLTREQAAVILSRNMMMQPSAGESLSFTDSRLLGEWSRGLVKTAVEYGVIKGYPDGSFQPQRNISRGEVATMLVNAIGTPINTPGEYTLGSTYGNVTVTSTGVTLRDTTIAGDLYLTGGVGLGSVMLENVTVLGRIIASGAGESNRGDSSVIMRNVQAQEMIVDSPSNQFVSLRAEGDTKIDRTSVRTPAYLEDTTREGYGLSYIELNGEEGTKLQLAGNIKDVVNLTLAGNLVIARGTAKSVTMDEKGVGAKLTIEQGATVKELQLDVATPVTGQGDIEHLTISADGCTSTIRPDKTTIRPGLTANIAGENMNTVTADEASQEPRILSGYPRTGDVAPTGATAAVSTNKAGTVYWAISPITDGSVTEDNLISPPTYGSNILRSGNIKITASNKEATAKITGLVSDGSYYLSSVLVDARGQRSPVKVTAFQTPDDSTPNFASGFPYMSNIQDTSAQVTVMATKSCKLYYALLKKNAAAPTAAEFKAGAITGNLGYGVYDVKKNETYPFTVNDKTLTELESYDLYLWLNDPDNAKSSAVKKLSFTTVDKTPPEWMLKPMVTKEQATAVDMTATLNETGTMYWVVVLADSEYPKPLAGSGETTVPLDSTTAKMQVSAGMGALKSGKVAMTEKKDATFSISGLGKEMAYDLYYVAQDKAGNYSRTVEKLRINTLDENAPSATLTFTEYNANDKNTPKANTNIEIRFSEIIQSYPEGVVLETLYKAVTAAKDDETRKAAKAELAKTLNSIITMYDLTSGTQEMVKVRDDSNQDDATLDWTVDYRNARVTTENGKTVITLPTQTETTANRINGLNLRSGSTYRIDLHGISDASRNAIGSTQLPPFTTLFAQIELISGDTLNNVSYTEADGSAATATLHMTFDFKPNSTTNVDSAIDWDMLIWSNMTLKFKMMRREKTATGGGTWEYLGEHEIVLDADSDKMMGSSLRANVQEPNNNNPKFPPINELKDGATYQYGLSFVTLDGSPEEKTWSKSVSVKISMAAGANNNLGNLATNVTASRWESALADKSLSSIGFCAKQNNNEMTMIKSFSDKVEPNFQQGHPEFEPSDMSVIIRTMLDRPGTIYYVLAPEGIISTLDANGNKVLWSQLPDSGASNVPPPELSAPGYQDITGNRLSGGNAMIKWGTTSGGTAVNPITVKDLQPSTKYVAYFVLKGTSSVYSKVLCYRFETEEVVRPILRLDIQNPTVNMRTDRNATVDYLLVTDNAPGEILKRDLKDYLAPGAGQLPTAYVKFTFLDALVTDVLENGESKGSVFDLYASTSAKSDMAAYVRNTGATANVVLKGKAETVQDMIKTVDCSGAMMGSTWYLFLAVAKSPLGSGDAFRAARPVYNLDTTAPTVINCSASLRESTALPGSYKGTLTITFSEELYYVQRDPSNPTVLQSIKGIEAIPGTAATNGDKFVPLLTVMSAPVGTKILTNIIEKPMTSVQLDLPLVRPGDAFTFSPKISDATGNSHNVTLTIKLVSKGAGVLPEFEVSPSVWNGMK